MFAALDSFLLSRLQTENSIRPKNPLQGRREIKICLSKACTPQKPILKPRPSTLDSQSPFNRAFPQIHVPPVVGHIRERSVDPLLLCKSNPCLGLYENYITRQKEASSFKGLVSVGLRSPSAAACVPHPKATAQGARWGAERYPMTYFPSVSPNPNPKPNPNSVLM